MWWLNSPWYQISIWDFVGIQKCCYTFEWWILIIARNLKLLFFFYQQFGYLDDTNEWPQSTSLWKTNHTENIVITLDFSLAASAGRRRTMTERIRTANFLSSPFLWKIFHYANICQSNTKSISKGTMLGQQNCWGCQNLLVPLPGGHLELCLSWHTPSCLSGALSVGRAPDKRPVLTQLWSLQAMVETHP